MSSPNKVRLTISLVLAVVALAILSASCIELNNLWRQSAAQLVEVSK